MSDDELLGRTVSVHPVLIVGEHFLLVSLGALLGETLFAQMAALIGISVVSGAVVWLNIALITIVIGLWRSVYDAE